MKNFRLIKIVNYLIIILLSASLACSHQTKKSESEVIFNPKQEVAAIDSVRYAKLFLIETFEDYIKLTINNPWHSGNTLKTFILVPKNKILPKNLPKGTIVRTPLDRTVSFGAVQCSFFAEFGALKSLVGVCDPQYINIPEVADGVKSGRIADIGAAANPNIERLMSLDADAVFTSPIEESGSGRIELADAPVVECFDYMETSPLGRAEWLRFYGLFCDRRREADSLFAITEHRYIELQTACSHFDNRPTVFTETVYSGVWWVSGGNSYMSRLLSDAGADYLWRDDQHTGSIGLSFETVLERAENADYWLFKYNSPYTLSLEQLAKEQANYSLFDAWKKERVYACNTGQTTFYEELPIHPDRILQDLVAIFHPEALQEYRQRFFKKLLKDSTPDT